MNKLIYFLEKYNTVMILFFMVILGTILSPRFLTTVNILNITQQVSALGIISLGMLFVILTGGIDLSVGSLMALSSVLIGFFLPFVGIFGSIIISLVVVLIFHSITGILIAKNRLPAFVVTLAMMTVARGVALIFSGGKPIQLVNPVVDFIGQGRFLGIPSPFYIFIIFIIATYIVLEKTYIGRNFRAIGSNEIAAIYSGIRINAYYFFAYLITAFSSVFAALISSARGGVASPTLASGFELDVIAACVIGGANLAGGKGGALQTVMGVFTLGIIANIMNLVGIPGYFQQVVKGLIIIFAVMGQKIDIVKLIKYKKLQGASK